MSVGDVEEMCLEHVRESVKVTFTVVVREVLTCPVHGEWNKQEGVKLEYVSTGRAMNLYEMLESLPEFLAENAARTLMKFCGHDDCMAGALIRDHANEFIPEGC